MNHSEQKALNIATEIVVARMQSSTVPTTKDGGKNTADFFKAIYEGVKEICESTTD